MVTTIERRVVQLEATAGGGGSCPDCGWDGDWSKVEYVVHWGNAGGSDGPEEFCETCGSQLTYKVHAIWEDSSV